MWSFSTRGVVPAGSECKTLTESPGAAGLNNFMMLKCSNYFSGEGTQPTLPRSL